MASTTRCIKKEDLAKWKSLVTPAKVTDQEQRRLALKKLSDARQDTWPNTLAAQRRKKVNAQRIRAAKLEATRQAVDRQENERREKERRDKINYATEMLYAQTDKVKVLQSAELLSECLKGREAQIRTAAAKREAEAEFERYWVELEKKQLARAEVENAAQDEVLRNKARHVAKMQQDQLKDHLDVYMEQLRIEKEEGEMIKAKAQADAAKDRAQRERGRRRARERIIEVKAANELLKQTRAEQARKAAEDERRAEKFALEKQELKKKQLQQERRLKECAAMQRQRMINQAVEDLKKFKANEEKRIEQQVAEARAAEDKRIFLQEERRRRHRESINASRTKQINTREEKKKADFVAERMYAEQWKRHNDRITQEEKEMANARREDAKRHQAFLLCQIRERKFNGKARKHAELQAARRAEVARQNEAMQFERYAKSRIDRLEARGMNTIPLRKAMQTKESLSFCL